MEVIIPLVAISGLYVATKNNDDNIENFENLDEIKDEVIDPENTKNYSHSEYNNSHELSSNNFHRDDYYNGNKQKQVKEEPVKRNKRLNYSLTGEPINDNNFKHNNMQPFFGAKIRGTSNNLNTSESILDNKTGVGSQKIRKTEQAPLFKPINNLNFANGAPNASDFYQSRVNESNKFSNYKPFESQQVAPGLDLGFTTEGSNGFNSGVTSRELWQPKDVDELRVRTNPKLSYSLKDHQGPASYYNKKLSNPNTRPIDIIGKVEKHLPDRYYESGSDRLFTTTGLEQGRTLRPKINEKFVNRPETNTEYVGNAGTTGADGVTYTHHTYSESNRNNYSSTNLPIVTATGQNSANPNDYNVKSFKNYLTNRDTESESHIFGNVGSALSAAIAPLIDVMKPSRKENVIGNARPYGDAGSTVPSTYVHNENDVTPVTNRQMYARSKDHFYVQKQNHGGYNVSNVVAQPSNRQETTRYYSGVRAAKHEGINLYDSTYSQEINTNKQNTLVGRAPNGNSNVFNNNVNVNVSKLESDRMNNRMWVPNNMSQLPPSAQTHGITDMQPHYNDKQDEEMNSNRIDPGLLSAFKSNPFTHSLNSSV